MNKDTDTDRDDFLNIWGSTGPKEALRQVVNLCRKALSLDIDIGADGSSFSSSKDDEKYPDGILSVSGRLINDSLITLRLELVRGQCDIRVSSSDLFRCLSDLGNRVRLCPPPEDTDDTVPLIAELDVKATPMAMAREMAFLKELRRLNELARTLQAELPQKTDDAGLIDLYKKQNNTLRPILPLRPSDSTYANIFEWAREVADYLSGSISVAVASQCGMATAYALSALAGILSETGDSIGVLIPPSVAAKSIPELAEQAPGRVAIPAARISMGTNIYEMGSEVGALLATLSAIQKPVLFTGTLQQLQSVFHGGQGAVNDPLLPVVCHVPDIPVDELVRFAIRSAGLLAGGLSARAEKDLQKKILSELQCLSPADQKRILPVVVKRTVYLWAKGVKTDHPASLPFGARLGGLSETLAGLSPRPRASRLPEVQERFTRVLTDPSLLEYFRKHLLAQDTALEQLVLRLSMEALTRPSHQPIRYCAQGTPATGKSESAVLLARRLGIPYINIDAASMPDYYTAVSQLLGSARGIVMSYQAGRLEQAAKHHTGVVLEVSDLDHAAPSVRSMLADLFLQVLETGEAQSTTGSMFSCANIIFAFTMNLPDGIDESVRKSVGFNRNPSHEEVSRRVISEIKTMLSGAFLSRVGTPILFEPLSGDALAVIVERAIERAVRSAAERLSVDLAEVRFDDTTGSKIIASMKTAVTSFGARAILEYGRSLAAKGFMEFYTKYRDSIDRIIISATPNGELVISPLVPPPERREAESDKGEWDEEQHIPGQ